MTQPTRKRHHKHQPKKGIRLEEAVARIQQMMDANSMVTKNEYLIDRLGNRREFDVVIRGQVSGVQILGVIECKDWAEKIGTPEIEAFVQKARNVNANIVLMVSKMGFTTQAMRLAIHEGIGTLSLLPNDPTNEKETGFTVGIRAYAEVWSWAGFGCRVLLSNGSDIAGDKIYYKKQSVIEWFMKELSTTYFWEHFIVGEFNVPITFKISRNLDIDGIAQEAVGIIFHAQRVLRKKKRWVRVTGDAYVDWRDVSLKIPPGGNLMSEELNTDFIGWEDWDGNSEEIGIGFELPIFNLLVIDPNTNAIDLKTL
jgi:hypothetical protein